MNLARLFSVDCTRILGTVAACAWSYQRLPASSYPSFRPTLFGMFALWADLVQNEGLTAARAIPGFRDHALKGTWLGYHAVRLSDAYRAIYIVHSDGLIETVLVEEVNKHDY